MNYDYLKMEEEKIIDHISANFPDLDIYDYWVEKPLYTKYIKALTLFVHTNTSNKNIEDNLEMKYYLENLLRESHYIKKICINDCIYIINMVV